MTNEAASFAPQNSSFSLLSEFIMPYPQGRFVPATGAKPRSIAWPSPSGWDYGQESTGRANGPAVCSLVFLRQMNGPLALGAFTNPMPLLSLRPEVFVEPRCIPKLVVPSSDRSPPIRSLKISTMRYQRTQRPAHPQPPKHVSSCFNPSFDTDERFLVRSQFEAPLS